MDTKFIVIYMKWNFREQLLYLSGSEIFWCLMRYMVMFADLQKSLIDSICKYVHPMPHDIARIWISYCRLLRRSLLRSCGSRWLHQQSVGVCNLSVNKTFSDFYVSTVPIIYCCNASTMSNNLLLTMYLFHFTFSSKSCFSRRVITLITECHGGGRRVQNISQRGWLIAGGGRCRSI